MNKIQQRVAAFSQLGHFLSQFSTSGIRKKQDILNNDLFFDAFKMQVERSEEFNGWFTLENVLFACESWSEALTTSNLEKFAADFTIDTPAKTIAVIMAGNIPLVGFHDFLTVLLSGNNILVKQSSNDKHLLPILAKYLEYTNEDFKGAITFTEDKLEGFDAVIATGSNNTARYFDYYFKKFPSVIRKSKNSVAVLTGNESEQELEGLADDIFRYFGLGCRSISKIFVPKEYNFDQLFKAVFKYKDIINYAKYANNYDYNKAVYLMSLFDMLENGFLMIKEDTSYASPIATLFYEYYDDIDSLRSRLNDDAEHIQCIAAKDFIVNEVPFGKTQQPALTDYADGINTINFLNQL